MVRFYLQLLVGGLMSYLRYMCLFAYRTWCPTRIVLCFRFVYLRLVYPMLPVSLSCSFLIAPTIFSNVYFIRFFVLPRVSGVFPFKWNDPDIKRIDRNTKAKIKQAKRTISRTTRTTAKSEVRSSFYLFYFRARSVYTFSSTLS